MARQDKDEDEDDFEVGDIPDWTTIADLRRTDFDALAEELDEQQEAKDEAERKIKVIRGELTKLFIKARVKTVGWNNRRVTRKDGMSSSISKDLLHKTAKVSFAMIEKCTIRRPWTTVVISKPKTEKEGEE